MFICQMAVGCNPQSDWISIARWLFGFASVTSLCSLVLDRYIAVVKPLKYLTFMKHRRVVQMVSLSWAIPVTFISMVSALNRFIFKLSLLFDVEFWMGVIFLEFLPCLIVIFCFASMLHVVCKHDRAARNTVKQLRFNHRVLFKVQEKSAIKIMAIVIGLFLLCYRFYMRCSFILIFYDRKPCNDEEYKIPLLVLNSAINPMAYAFYKRDIKQEIERRICCVTAKKRNRVVEPVNADNCFTLES